MVTPGPENVRTLVRWALLAIALTVISFVLNYIGSDIYRRAGSVTTVKPFCGVALAVCLIWGKRLIWPVLICGTIGAAAAKIAFGASTEDCILIPLLASACVLVTYFLIIRLRPAVSFRSWKDLTLFIFLAISVCAASGLFFAGNYYVSQIGEFTANWKAWTIATTLSFVTFTPPIVLLATADLISIRQRRYRILASLVAFAVILGVNFIQTPYPTLFLVPCGILLIILAGEIEGAAIALAITQIAFTVGPLMGHAPIAVARLPLGYQIYFFQVFISVLVAIMLPAAAAITGRRILRDEMKKSLVALRESEQRYMEMAKEAAEANRAKSEFLANMSHELRTPLNAILGFSEMIQEQLLGPLGDHRYCEYGKHIHSSGEHLLSLINDILDLSKIDAGKMDVNETVFSLNDLVEETVLVIKPRAKHLSLTVQLPAETIRVEADRRLTKQVMLNLLSNAAKFTPEGGRINVQLGLGREGEIELVVADSGIGMSKDELQIAFSQYGQVDSKIARAHQGSGLGLPISQSLARLQGGHITASSIPQEGTTMTFVLPRSRTLRDLSRTTRPAAA